MYIRWTLFRTAYSYSRSVMNRPRNRQPRPAQSQAGRGRGGQSRGARGHEHPRQHSPQPAYPASVPSVRQVVPGARVSIVLKQDQPTGREVQGTVSEVLTRGNHPRGIKVRLQDGRVGRVQRMAVANGPEHQSVIDAPFQQLQESSNEPPPRTLADFIREPDDDDEAAIPDVAHEFQGLSTADAVCPICGTFKGDEIAVSHHVESHLS